MGCPLMVFSGSRCRQVFTNHRQHRPSFDTGLGDSHPSPIVPNNQSDGNLPFFLLSVYSPASDLLSPRIIPHKPRYNANRIGVKPSLAPILLYAIPRPRQIKEKSSTSFEGAPFSSKKLLPGSYLPIEPSHCFTARWGAERPKLRFGAIKKISWRALFPHVVCLLLVVECCLPPVPCCLHFSGPDERAAGRIKREGCHIIAPKHSTDGNPKG